MSKKNKRGTVKSHGPRQKMCRNATRNKTETERRKKGEITYIAVDSCVIIDMMRLIKREPNTKKDPEYYLGLKRLLYSNIFHSDGTKNHKGRFAMCVLPSVYKELSNDHGILHHFVKDLITNRMIIIEINQSYKADFNKKVDSLAKSYAKKGLFIDEQQKIMTDAYIVAEAAIFNLTLISRDKDIIQDFSQANPRSKIDQIKSINKKQLFNEFNPYLAEPRHIDKFFSLIAKGETMPQIENSQILDISTKQTMQKGFHFHTARQTNKKPILEH